MIDKLINSFKKKSPKGRFLLVMGILFLGSYFVLGLLFIFMKNLPIQMAQTYRNAFGLLLMVYAIIRFFRIINDNKE